MARKLLPDIVSLTPSSYESFVRCHRLFLLGHLLGVPASDPIPTPDRGQLVHELLRFVHERGNCRDNAHVEEVLSAHGVADDVHRTMFRRHAERCPEVVDAGAHEKDIARFHRFPAPMFMANARIDAIWVHDGILDARDYKTGQRWHDRVADDPAAQVQAFVLAPHAQRRGLRLRIRYEYLAPEIDDDPDPFEPDDDDLEAIAARLHGAVHSMFSQESWRGCGEAQICRTCRYRSICADSAATGEPEWAALGLRQ
ncbi:MAG: nuclease superfamily [Actinomycetia bacterium]|nr:nuclease superfamily [Actinomycetes bacterium]